MATEVSKFLLHSSDVLGPYICLISRTCTSKVIRWLSISSTTAPSFLHAGTIRAANDRINEDRHFPDRRADFFNLHAVNDPLFAGPTVLKSFFNTPSACTR